MNRPAASETFRETPSPLSCISTAFLAVITFHVSPSDSPRGRGRGQGPRGHMVWRTTLLVMQRLSAQASGPERLGLEPPLHPPVWAALGESSAQVLLLQSRTDSSRLAGCWSVGTCGHVCISWKCMAPCSVDTRDFTSRVSSEKPISASEQGSPCPRHTAPQEASVHPRYSSENVWAHSLAQAGSTLPKLSTLGPWRP